RCRDPPSAAAPLHRGVPCPPRNSRRDAEGAAEQVLHDPSGTSTVSVERTDVRRLQALLALLDVELDLLVLVQAAVAAGLDGAEVREDVLAAVVRGDEAEALVSVEPLDGSGGHVVTPSRWC